MIYLGADKHGLRAIQIVTDYLRSKDVPHLDLGVKQQGEDMALAELIPRVTRKVLEDKQNMGILSCGTGVGIEIGANKFSGIRACLATNERVAEYARIYDDCNVLCLVGWESDKRTIEKILDIWLKTEYDGSETRLKMFEAFDTWGGRAYMGSNSAADTQQSHNEVEPRSLR